MKTLRRFVPAVLVVALLAGSLTSCEWPEGTRYVHEVFSDYDLTTGIHYRSTTSNTGQPVDLALDIYEPAGDTLDERPVIMWMYGGYWQGGNRTQLAAYARDSARRGYVAVAIDYRTWQGDGFNLVTASNNAYDDTIAAIEWLQENADEYDLDPDAIVPAGYSAGAINALHAVYRPASSPAAGAVSIAGMTFNPPTADRPPAIMFNGTEDALVPYSSASGSCSQARDVGNTCELVTYEGEGHGIGFQQIDDIQERTAHFVFEKVLWPLGYRAQKAPAA